MLKMTGKEKIAWVFMFVFAIVGPLVFAGCVVDSGIGDNAPETEESTPDAGVTEKANCPSCVTACKTLCYNKRYNEARACTSYTSYSYCVNQCDSATIPNLEPACTSQYLAWANCVNASPSPIYQCSNNVSVIRESWRCNSQSLSLAWCRTLN